MNPKSSTASSPDKAGNKPFPVSFMSGISKNTKLLIVGLIATIMAGFPLVSSATALPCTPTDQVDIAKLKSRIIIMGELHGTNEIPALVAGVACLIVGSDKPLILGLEIPSGQQEALNTFLNSPGNASDKQRLIDSEVGKPMDGRVSHAIFSLIEAMRKLRAAGRQVTVMGFDINQNNLPLPLYPGEKIWKGERDMAMARNIESRARVYSDHTILILTGAVHSWRTKGAPWDAEYESMTSLLLQRLPAHVIGVRSIKGGTHWG